MVFDFYFDGVTVKTGNTLTKTLVGVGGGMSLHVRPRVKFQRLLSCY